MTKHTRRRYTALIKRLCAKAALLRVLTLKTFCSNRFAACKSYVLPTAQERSVPITCSKSQVALQLQNGS
eukprot:10722797-Ditylum_brightwellii.AAC.1